MSDDRTTATGFARQFKDTAQNAGPPPRPKPAPPAAAPDSPPTPEPDPTHPNGKETVGEGNEARTTPDAEPRKNAASQPDAEPAQPVTGVEDEDEDEDEEYIPTGFQLSLEHIQRIQDYADQHRVFRQIAFEELIEQAITNLGDNPTIPPAPKRRGPDDYEYRRQLSVRIRPTLLTRLDQLAEQNPKDGRSHVVRVLLNATARNVVTD